MNEEPPRCYHHKHYRDRCIKQHVHEVFVIIEANKVGNPRTMMIHFKNAFIAL